MPSPFVLVVIGLAIAVLSEPPKQIHLSLASPDVMTAMWVTSKNTSTTTVQFGTTTSLGSSATGSTHTYTAGGWDGVIHEANITLSFAPDTEVFYRVGCAEGWSETVSFRTPPAPNARPVVFSVFGDMGTAIPLGFEVCKQMEEDAKSLPFDVHVHVGDLAYASTKYDLPAPLAMATNAYDALEIGFGEEELIWDAWFDQIEPLAQRSPYMAGVGNHEKFYDYASYLARFRLPQPWGGNPGSAKFWFSMDYGHTHWTFMSTEHPYDEGSEQYKWLEQDFAHAVANRANTPFIFLTGHRPMYSTDTSEKNSHWPGAHFQRTIEPLMIKYEVDVYFSGHMHMYERVNPVRNGTAVVTNTNVYKNPGAPLHVVQGTAGIFQDSKYVDPQPAWSASRMGKFGYGRLTVHNASAMYYEFRGLNSDKIWDSLWLLKE